MVSFFYYCGEVLDSMEAPRRSWSNRIATPLFLAAYASAVFILLVTVRVPHEKKSDFLSLKARIHESDADFTNFSFLQPHLRAILKLEDDQSVADHLLSLQYTLDAAAKCLPQHPHKSELTASNVACLRKILRLVVSNDSTAPPPPPPALFKDKQSRNDDIEDLKRVMEVKAKHLRQSVEFFPLKDVNVAPMTEPDRTWFMSMRRGKGRNGNRRRHYFPSRESNGKIVCIKSRQAAYGFAWPEYLPPNSTLLPGLTFISDASYDYHSPWHSMHNLVVSVAYWRTENQCKVPDRFILYHQGRLVRRIGSWISNVLEATLGRQIKPDLLEYGDVPVCFERAVVYRRGLDHMSKQKRIALFDMIRCKVRKFCNISESQRIVNGIRTIHISLVAGTGAGPFKNESLVASVIAEECKKVPGCNFRLLHVANFTFCQQVEAMSRTDIMATVHGAQFTNMMFMSKGSSVMEIFSKGWLEGAGVGKYTFHWFTSWAGMNHEGTYRDTQGPDCPNPDPVQCFLFYKDRQVGHNQTYLAQWTVDVLKKFKNRTSSMQELEPSNCTCDSEYF